MPRDGIIDTPPPEGDLPSRASALALLGGTALTVIDLLTGAHAAALAALGLVLLHVLLRWRILRTNARSMLGLAAVLATGFAATGGTREELALAASRALYLPALLAVMTLLRVAARRSARLGVAARCVTDQPPGRRFALLAAGAHLFGILLNVGGFQLLLRTALEQRAGGDGPAARIRSRRITAAVMCGFGATLMWSPLGVAMNLLIPVMPELDWLDFAPFGLAMVAGFVGLGWLFDRAGPRPRSQPRQAPPPGAAGALLSLVLLLLAITGSAALCERLLGVPIRAAVLLVIPPAALVWVLITEPGPGRRNLASVSAAAFRALPESVNEICLIGATGFLGLIVAAALPADAVRGVVSWLGLGPGPLSALVVAGMVLASLAGLSPMISGTALAGAIVGAGIDMPQPMLMVATLTGWTGAMMLSPVTATVAIAAAATGQSAATVGLRWNGRFTFTYVALLVLILLAWGTLLP
ncbi:hypothetical protein [Oceanicella sp. SM1341]|uniref:hypothetical protein n=1 Tax=Oceanicella sp. SM1341 TaxID=1548889 RepID=UPI000E519BC8|nr:hypothetical protein [Oceanicella sp. SM1341]